MKKKYIIIILVALIFTSIIILILQKKQEIIYSSQIIDLNNTENVKISGNIKYNISKPIKEKHYLYNGNTLNKNMYITNLKITSSAKTNKSTITAKLYNNDKDYQYILVFIYFYDKNGKIIDIYEYSIDSIKKNSKMNIEIEFAKDFSNCYDVKLIY